MKEEISFQESRFTQQNPFLCSSLKGQQNRRKRKSKDNFCFSVQNLPLRTAQLKVLQPTKIPSLSTTYSVLISLILLWVGCVAHC